MRKGNGPKKDGRIREERSGPSMAVICEGAHPAQKPARRCAPGRWRQWGAVTTPDQKGQGGRAPPDALERVGGAGARKFWAVGCERPSLSLSELLPRARGEGEAQG